MTGEVDRKTQQQGELGTTVAVMATGLVVVVLGALAYSRLFGGDPAPVPTDDELVATLLTEAEVDDAAVVPGPYASVAFDDAVERLDVDFAGAESEYDLSECHELARLVLPGRSHPAAAAFQRSDGTVVLHTVDLADDDMSVADLSDWPSNCIYHLDGGSVRPQAVTGASVEIDDLGDSAFWTNVDLRVTPRTSGTAMVSSGYLYVVVVERDQVVSTVTVIEGTNLSRERDLALSLAEAAEAKLANST